MVALTDKDVFEETILRGWYICKPATHVDWGWRGWMGLDWLEIVNQLRVCSGDTKNSQQRREREEREKRERRGGVGYAPILILHFVQEEKYLLYTIRCICFVFGMLTFFPFLPSTRLENSWCVNSWRDCHVGKFVGWHRGLTLVSSLLWACMCLVSWKKLDFPDWSIPWWYYVAT